jgi:hypothetical protein
MKTILICFLSFWYSSLKTNSEDKFNIRSLNNDVKIETIIPKSGIWFRRCRDIEKWTGGGTCVLLKIQNNSNKTIQFITTTHALIVSNRKSFSFKNEKDNSTMIDGELVFRNSKIKHPRLEPKQTIYSLFLVESFHRYFFLNFEKLKPKDLRKIQIRIADFDENKLDVEVTPNKGFYFE